MDNSVYGMTKGQASPTTEPDWEGSKLTPDGTHITPFQPLGKGEEARAGQTERDVGSIGKYRWANMVKGEQDIAMSALGAQGLGWEGPGFDDRQLERTRAWLITRADSIWGGTNEVQLNVIAKRVLQIPE
jgi:alkylation response protein AidB-like acyl-CoA dehydrogenase